MKAVAGLVWLIALFIATPASAQPPAEAYGRLPAIADAAISPDGSKVVLAVSEGEATYLAVIDLASERGLYRAEVADKTRLRSVGWASDDRVSFVMSRTFHPNAVLPSFVRFRGSPTRVDYYRSGVLDLTRRKIELFTTDDAEGWQDQGATLIAPIEGDPGFGRMIGTAPGIGEERRAVFRVDLVSGRSREMSVPGANGNTLDYILDENGAVAARLDAEEASNRWSLFVYQNNRPRLLMSDVSETGAPVSVQGLTTDGKIAILDEGDTGDLQRLFAVDPADGTRTQLFARDAHDVADAIRDPWTRRVVGVSWMEEDSKQQFFDADLQRAYEAAAAQFSSGHVMFMSWSRDRSRILLYAERSLDGGGYYVFTPANNTVRALGMLYPEKSGAQPSVRQSITYRARDGARIPAYLTMPRGENRNLPLVVLVHGGPHARDTMGFDWWSAFLVSRGYAVLQPNFRGSTGYGARWEVAGRGQWGGLMQTDVEDGVATLVRTGIADAQRVCIVGASYGGYAALAGATLTPDRYRCAASIAGVADLDEFLRQRQRMTGSRSMSSDWWRLSIGDREEDRERIRAVSPVNLAERVRIPILLMHGTDDTVVPITQSRRMHARLREARKDVRLVELRGDDHWLSDADTRIQMLRELETFLATHLSGRPAPVGEVTPPARTEGAGQLE